MSPMHETPRTDAGRETMDHNLASEVRALLDVLQEGAALVDASGSIRYANRALADILQCDAESLRGLPLRAWLSTGAGDQLQACLENGRPTCLRDEEIVLPDGRNLSLSIQCAPHGQDVLCTILDHSPQREVERDYQRLLDTQANLLEIGSRHLRQAELDIEWAQAESRWREEGLKRAEASYRALFKAFPLPAFAWRSQASDFALEEVNEAAVTLTQGQALDMIGVLASEHFQDAPDLLEAMRRALDEARTVTLEHLYAGFVGEERYVLWHFAFVPPDLVLAHAQDVHQQKLAELELSRKSAQSDALARQRQKELSGARRALASEKALRVSADGQLSEQQTFLREIIDLDPSLIFVKDWDERFILANKATGRFLGHSPEFLLNRREADLAPWLNRGPDSRKQDRLVMTTLQDHVSEEALRDAQGELRWFRTYKRPLVAPNGLAQRVLAVSVDITEQQQARERLLTERDLLAGIMETSPDGILVLDRQGRVEFANAVTARLLDMKPSSSRGPAPVKELMRCSFRDATSLPIQHVLERREPLLDWPLTILCRDEIHHLSVNAAPLLNSSDQVDKIVCTLQDVTARRNAVKEISKLSRAVEQSPSSVIITDLQGRIEYVNPRFTEVTGYSAEEVLGQSPGLLKSNHHGKEFYKGLWDAITGGHEWRGEICNRTKDGREIWEIASISPVFDEQGRLINYVAVKEDITEKKEQQDRIQHLAMHDLLTGLPNRILFHDRLEQAISRGKRFDKMAALLFVDLDEFKRVNDNYGHRVGDQIIKDAAQRIAKCIRSVDTAARFGGDEFVIVLQDLEDAKDANQVAERVIASICRPYQVDGKTCVIGVSIGIALYPTHGLDPDTLLRNADQAMYQSKNDGRNTYTYYSSPNSKTER